MSGIPPHYIVFIFVWVVASLRISWSTVRWLIAAVSMSRRRRTYVHCGAVPGVPLVTMEDYANDECTRRAVEALVASVEYASFAPNPSTKLPPDRQWLQRVQRGVDYNDAAEEMQLSWECALIVWAIVSLIVSIRSAFSELSFDGAPLELSA